PCPRSLSVSTVSHKHTHTHAHTISQLPLIEFPSDTPLVSEWLLGVDPSVICVQAHTHTHTHTHKSNSHTHTTLTHTWTHTPQSVSAHCSQPVVYVIYFRGARERV